MAIPKFDEITRPLLNYMAECDCQQTTSQIREVLKQRLNITDAEALKTFPTDRRISIWQNRLAWAITYLKKAGLLKSISRGVYEITPEGKKDTKKSSQKITRDYLKQFSRFNDFLARYNSNNRYSTTLQSQTCSDDSSTPEEAMNNTRDLWNENLIADIKEGIAKIDPFEFEKLVVDLIEAMGYGGLEKGMPTKVTKKSNDEGIDGIIYQDTLGIDTIHLQAKRWQNPVGRKEIQSFVGALAGKHSNKGIFITTSKFCDTAIKFVKTISQKVILIDGDELANLMIKYNVGVSLHSTYELKKLDLSKYQNQ